MQLGRRPDNRFLVLDALAADVGRASMGTMRQYIEANYKGRDVSLGRMAEILSRFEDTGWVKWKWSEPGTRRGQRRKKIYTITGLGQAVLHAERAALEAYDASFEAGLAGGGQ